MFSKVTVAIAGLAALASTTAVPGTLIISVVDSAGATLGTLNGYGNFSSPGPSYPFRATATTEEDSTLRGYESCNADGFLSCYDNGAGEPGQFKQLDNGNLALEGTEGTWSVDNTTDASGGTTPNGYPYGIPVYIGDTAAIPVTLVVRAASG